MKNDIAGVSTCPIGKEHWEFFAIRIGGKKYTYIQYDYRLPDGRLFSRVRPSLEACRIDRDIWIGAIAQTDELGPKKEQRA
ncbi:DUF3873 family protein [Candidatus Roizmanbacteria bacterium]|nr:DUF3873 family protein [Candidatus Roizmanbacteria bacterium]